MPYVRPHIRKGRPVRGHYRRRPPAGVSLGVILAVIFILYLMAESQGF